MRVSAPFSPPVRIFFLSEEQSLGVLRLCIIYKKGLGVLCVIPLFFGVEAVLLIVAIDKS